MELALRNINPHRVLAEHSSRGEAETSSLPEPTPRLVWSSMVLHFFDGLPAAYSSNVDVNLAANDHTEPERDSVLAAAHWLRLGGHSWTVVREGLLE